MPSYKEIEDEITRRNGQPPFVVWTAAFREIISGVDSSGMPAHQGRAPDIDLAIEQYLSFIDPKSFGTNVRITEQPKIVDATGVQVYP